MYICVYVNVCICILCVYIWLFVERLFVERMHQKKANAETLCKVWFVPFPS